MSRCRPVSLPDVDEFDRAGHAQTVPIWRPRQYNHERHLLSYAEAEKQLRNPSVNAIGVAVAPIRASRVPPARNIQRSRRQRDHLPVLNGGLFKARHEEAESHAREPPTRTRRISAGSDCARDVPRSVALNANDAFRRLDVTARMVELRPTKRFVWRRPAMTTPWAASWS